MATSTSATIRGISYSKGDKFTCYAAAKGTEDSLGGGKTAKSTVKGDTYYFYYKATGDGVVNPYGIGASASGGVQGWYPIDVFPYKTYTIKYDANGGSGAPSNTNKNHGVKFTLSSTTPTRSKSTTTYTVTYNVNGGNALSSTTATAKETTTYTFDSWNTAKNGSGETFKAKGAYTGNANVTFYAQWNSSTTKASVTLPTPTRSGYTFKGWYDKASGGNKIASGGASYTPSSSITLYAQWSASAEYTLFYQPNGDNVTNMPADQTKLHDTNLKISSTIPTRTGYTFSHWNTASNGSKYGKHPTKTSVTYNGTNITCNDYIESNDNVTLYAIWVPITYTVKFNGNGGTGSMSNQSFTYGTAQALTANTFKREYKITYNANGGSVSTTSATASYSFNKWNTKADGSGISYSNKQSVSNLTSTSGGTVNLYAQWNTGSVTLPEPTRSGYAFEGWYTNGTKVGNDGDSYTPTSAITLQAKWTPITYTIRFNKGHSSATGTMANQIVECGRYVSLSTNKFSLANHDFQGWATSNGSTTVTYRDRAFIRDLGEAGETIDLFAVWKKIQYTITYNLNGGTGATAPATAIVDQGGQHTVSSTTAYKAGEVTGYQITFNSNGGNQSNQVVTAKNSVGYKFLNWNTSSSGNGTIYTVGQKITNIKNSLSLYAKYSTTDYSLLSNGSVTAPTVSKSSGTSSWTVNIDGNGGNGTTLTSNAPITYSCDAWDTINEDKRCGDKGSYVPSQSETLYARWKATMGDHEAVILPSNLTRTGYTLLGFATGSTSASAQYAPGASYTPTADGATLYAVWKPNVYTMTINPNGGEIYSNGAWISNNLTTKFAYGTNTFIGSPIAGTSYTISLGASTTLSLDTRTQALWGGSSSYNISLTYSSQINDVSETNGVVSLKNPTSIKITSLSDASVLIGKYVSFNNKIYFIPSTATFSEVESGGTWNKTYTLTSSASQTVSAVETNGSFSYTSNNIGRKTNYVFSGYSAPGGKAFLNSDGATFYFNGEYPNNYENQASSTDTYIFNGQSAGDITITAQYRRAGFIITYKVNNSKLENTFSWNDTIHEFGIPGNVQTAESTPIYEFLGWNTKADGTGTWYSSGQQVGDLATNDGDVITLYAQWKLKNLVQVYKNGSFQNAQLYIWKDGKWNLTTVYLWKNNDWKMSTGH